MATRLDATAQSIAGLKIGLRLNEATGATTVADFLGGRTGTVVGTVTFGASPLMVNDPNTIAEFPGNTGRITIPADADTNMGASHSWAFGFRTSTNGYILNRIGTGSPTPQFTLYVQDALLRATINPAGSATNPVFSSSFTQNADHFLVFVKTGDVLTVYVDGVQVYSNTPVAGWGSYTYNTNLAIHARDNGTDSGFTGKIGPYYEWAAALTAQQVRDLWADFNDRVRKSSPYVKLINAQAGSLTTRLFHVAGYNEVGDGILADQARVGHGLLTNSAAFAVDAWTNKWRGLPYGGPVLRLNGSTQCANLGIPTGCLPAVNAGGISGSCIIKPSSVTSTRTIWGVYDGTTAAYAAIVDGYFTLQLSDGTNSVTLASDDAVVANNTDQRVGYSLDTDGTALITVNGVQVDASVTGDWPTLIDPTQSICVGALGGSSPTGYFGGDVAENTVNFGQTRTLGEDLAGFISASARVGPIDLTNGLILP